MRVESIIAFLERYCVKIEPKREDFEPVQFFLLVNGFFLANLRRNLVVWSTTFHQLGSRSEVRQVTYSLQAWGYSVTIVKCTDMRWRLVEKRFARNVCK